MDLLYSLNYKPFKIPFHVHGFAQCVTQWTCSLGWTSGFYCNTFFKIFFIPTASSS